MSSLTKLKQFALSHAGRTETGFLPGAAGYLSDEEVAQLSETLGAEYLAFLKQTGLPDNSLIRTNFTKKLNADGRLPDNYSIGEGGRVVKDMSKTRAALTAGLVVGAPALAYGAGGGAAASGSSAAAPTGSTAATAGSAAATGGTAAGGGAAASGGAAAAGAGGASIWGSIARNAIPIAGQIGSSIVQSRANTEATRLETEAADRALKQQREMYDQDVARERERIARDEGRYNTNQSQLQPYYDSGLSSLNQLNRGLGQPQVAAPPPAQAARPTATPTGTAPQWPAQPLPGSGANPPAPGSMPPQGGSLNALGPSQGLAVAMIDPHGRQLLVPQSEVADATAHGARMAS